MTRLAIVSLYDSDGKVYPYLEFYLSELKKVVESMIIVFNGILQFGEREKLERFTKRIYERDNIGYDAGAYKYVFERHMTAQEWENYDELVLSNDTCFGPLESFEEIFSRMDQKGSFDFWGINGIDDGIYRYLQSNFIVIKKQAFGVMRKYFKESVDEYASKMHDICIQFERGLFVRLKSEGFKVGSYVEYNDLDAYDSSFFLIKDYRCPIFKKKTDYIHCKENILCAIKYIRENTPYDTLLVEDYFYNKYQIELNNYELTEYFPECIHISHYNVSRNDIKEYINNNKSVYIYGIGKEADYFLVQFKDDISNLKGFIVSDNMYIENHYHQYRVYKMSDLRDKGKKIGIIVALNSKNTSEVRANLVDYNNILYLSE